MPCGNSDSEYTGEIASCSNDSTSLNAGTASASSVSVASTSSVSGVSARKKPIKLDIAAILAEAPTMPAAPQDESDPIRSNPESDSAVPTDQDASISDDIRVHFSGPADILLLILCIVLGIGILAMAILIAWPNIIPVLFYRG